MVDKKNNKKIDEEFEEITLEQENVLLEEGGYKEKLKKIKKELKECQDKNKEYLDGWQG